LRTEVTVTVASFALTAAVTPASSDPVTGVSLSGFIDLSGPVPGPVLPVLVLLPVLDGDGVDAALDSAAPVPISPAAATTAATPLTILFVFMLTPW
jgi:hypothetical protein